MRKPPFLRVATTFVIHYTCSLYTKSFASTVLFTLPPLFLYIQKYFLSFQFPTVLSLKYKPKPKQNKTKSLTKPISSLPHISIPPPFLPNRNPSFLSSLFFFFNVITSFLISFSVWLGSFPIPFQPKKKKIVSLSSFTAKLVV